MKALLEIQGPTKLDSLAKVCKIPNLCRRAATVSMDVEKQRNMRIWIMGQRAKQSLLIFFFSGVVAKLVTAIIGWNILQIQPLLIKNPVLGGGTWGTRHWWCWRWIPFCWVQNHTNSWKLRHVEKTNCFLGNAMNARKSNVRFAVPGQEKQDFAEAMDRNVTARQPAEECAPQSVPRPVLLTQKAIEGRQRAKMIYSTSNARPWRGWFSILTMFFRWLTF